MKGVVFDLDGTLLDTLEDLADCANQALLSKNLQTHPLSSYYHFIGQGSLKLIEKALGEASRDADLLHECHNEFLTLYAQGWNLKTKIYSGIQECLDLLTENSTPIAVWSNKPHDRTLECVEHYFKSFPFSPILGHRQSIPKKPNPEAFSEILSQWQLKSEDITYIGDSMVDYQTAKNCGMEFIGVDWGYGDLSPLHSSTTTCLQAVEALNQIFKKTLSR